MRVVLDSPPSRVPASRIEVPKVVFPRSIYTPARGADMSSTSWLDDASHMPIAFALVREDPELDRLVVQQKPEARRILMVASGGCTAAYLACLPRIEQIHLVDPNPAQLALARLKLHLLQTAKPEERKAILGHASLD